MAHPVVVDDPAAAVVAVQPRLLRVRQRGGELLAQQALDARQQHRPARVVTHSSDDLQVGGQKVTQLVLQHVAHRAHGTRLREEMEVDGKGLVGVLRTHETRPRVDSVPPDASGARR